MVRVENSGGLTMSRSCCRGRLSQKQLESIVADNRVQKSGLDHDR